MKFSPKFGLNFAAIFENLRAAFAATTDLFCWLYPGSLRLSRPSPHRHLSRLDARCHRSRVDSRSRSQRYSTEQSKRFRPFCRRVLLARRLRQAVLAVWRPFRVRRSRLNLALVVALRQSSLQRSCRLGSQWLRR